MKHNVTFYVLLAVKKKLIYFYIFHPMNYKYI